MGPGAAGGEALGPGAAGGDELGSGAVVVGRFYF